jgi:transcriptional regulator with PAS, ATPase and Fis domain
MPWLMQRAMSEVNPKLGAQIATYELVALRKWPGNVRELLHEARHAAHAAQHEGVDLVRPDHFAKDAGMELGPAPSESGRSDSTPSVRNLDDAEIERVLADHAGNVTAAARALGLHRNQLRRWVDKKSGTKTPAS